MCAAAKFFALTSRKPPFLKVSLRLPRHVAAQQYSPIRRVIHGSVNKNNRLGEPNMTVFTWGGFVRRTRVKARASSLFGPAVTLGPAQTGLNP
jgi:hypothetical protein